MTNPGATSSLRPGSGVVGSRAASLAAARNDLGVSYAPRMRTRALPWLCMLYLGTPGCGDEGVERDLSVTLGTATISGREDQPEALALLDVTAQLEATVDLEAATVSDARIVALPEGPDSAELEFVTQVRGPQDASTLDLPGGETVNARITNVATTNAELQPFCRAAVVLRVTVSADEFDTVAERELTVSCT